MDGDRILAIIDAVATAARDEERPDRVRAARDTLERMGNGQPTTGGPTLDALAPGLPETLGRWIGDGTSHRRQARRLHAVERAKELLEKVKRSGEVREVYDASDLFAELPAAEYATLKTELKEVLGDQINLNDLDRAVNEARRDARRHKIIGGDLPAVEVSDRPLRAKSRDARDALLQANDPPFLYSRLGEMVRIIELENGQRAVEPVDDASLRGRLTRVANFVATHEDSQRHVDPPMAVVRDLLVTKPSPFPVLKGLVETPVLTPDGSVLSTRGYDPSTGLFLAPAPGLRVPRIPETPTDEDVRAALRLIHEALWDFPFVSPADLANCLGLLLSPVVRPAIEGPVPLAMITKPKAGTGASLIVELVAMISTGRRAEMMSAPGTDEEMRKQITSMLLAGGGQVAAVDNVEGTFYWPSLARALTASTWRDRILGLSKIVSLPQRAVWIINGNNINPGGDLPRRCYQMRLDSRMAQPWLRPNSEFRHPQLLPWVAAHRGELLAALLTLARAWYAAGRPEADTPVIGSYEEWSRVVGGILAHAGVEDFLANLTDVYEQTDDEGRQWETFLAALLDKYGREAVTSARVAEDLRKDAELRETLPDALAAALESGTGSFQRRLGKAFAARADTRYGDRHLRVVRVGEKRRALLWRVREGSDGESVSPVSLETLTTGPEIPPTGDEGDGPEDGSETPNTPNTPNPPHSPDDPSIADDARWDGTYEWEGTY